MIAQQDQANSIVPMDTGIQMKPREIGAFGFQPMTIFTMSSEELSRLKLLAEMLAESSLLFSGSKQIKNKGDYFLVMLKGLEIGLPPLTAIDYIDAIQGKPALNGKGMLATIQGSPACEDIQIDLQADKCIVTMTRKGKSPITVEFGDKEASDYMTTEYVNGVKTEIPLIEKTNYKSQKLNMYRWRAITACARLVFPDVIGGMLLAEELDPNLIMNESGEVIESTATKVDPTPTPKNVTQMPQTKKPEAPKVVCDGAWLKDTSLDWFRGIIDKYKLDKEKGFTSFVASAKTWTDVAKYYANRLDFENAIRTAASLDAIKVATDFEAPSETTEGTATEQAYKNDFELLELPENWDGDGLDRFFALVDKYFDDNATELIHVGMAIDPNDFTPAELWQAVVDYCIETQVDLKVTSFTYTKTGKTGRIATEMHPVLAVCFSRTEFTKLINDDAFVKVHGISEWDGIEPFYELSRPLTISYVPEIRKGDKKVYYKITGVEIADNTDDLAGLI